MLLILFHLCCGFTDQYLIIDSGLYIRSAVVDLVLDEKSTDLLVLACERGSNNSCDATVQGKKTNQSNQID